VEGAVIKAMVSVLISGILLGLGIALLRTAPHLFRQRGWFAAGAAGFFGAMSLIGAAVGMGNIVGLMDRPALLR
jgi:hypothetical protein